MHTQMKKYKTFCYIYISCNKRLGSAKGVQCSCCVKSIDEDVCAQTGAINLIKGIEITVLSLLPKRNATLYVFHIHTL